MNVVAVYRKLVAIALTALSALGILVVSSAEPASGQAGRAPAGDAFYVPPPPNPKLKPGTIIRSTPIAGAPSGARAWKVLYHSRAVDGTDIAVSGVVIAPTRPAPRGGRVVVTRAHGTSGLADVCAPSKQSDIASGAASTYGPAGYGAWMPMMQSFLDSGYVVAATDYEGLGTPGLHPYLVGESEGRSVLDAARAARGLKAAAATKKVLVFGHAQGGHAALFAGELAASYAPELSVLGVVAGAPITDVDSYSSLLGSVPAGNGYVVMIVEGFHAAYPWVDPAEVLTTDAQTQSSIVDQKCALDVATTFSTSPNLVLKRNLNTSPGIIDLPALATILHKNSAGNRPAGAPLLIVQGTADELVPQFLTDSFVQKACAAGDTVEYRLVPGANHSGELPVAANEIAAWFADRVSGAPATSTCTKS